MDSNRLHEIIEGFAGRRITAVGDLMLDEFIWGEVRRISPEAPVPVVEVRRESWHLGGVGNVVMNLLGLGAIALPVAVVGDDPAGQRVRGQSADAGADTSGIIVDSTRPTTRKTRVVAHSQQMVRFDREERSALTASKEEQLVALCEIAIDQCDALIISDYEKGTLTPHVLQSAIGRARQQQKLVLVDPKIRNWNHYRDVDVITPNQSEAERATSVEIVDESSLKSAARSIQESLGCRNVLITRGERGMSLLAADGHYADIPTVAREVYDVTGAGDTVIAALTLALTSGATIEEAAVIANHAAGIVVGKVGTATLSRAELIESLKN